MVQLKKWIEDAYPLQVKSLSLLDAHFGTEVYQLQADSGKYVLKMVPRWTDDLEEEGTLTAFLLEKGIPVAPFLKNRQGRYSVTTEDRQFHIQDFIEGNVFSVNTAPDWFLEQFPSLLGRIHRALQDYKALNPRFDQNFFSIECIRKKLDYLSGILKEETAAKNPVMAAELSSQIKHAEKLLSVKIDPERLSFSNSHGDCHIGQILVKEKHITVIDWTAACCMPLAIEVIVSYVFADPACGDGSIDLPRLQAYIRQYMKEFPLTAYDVEMMPYLLYWHQFLTNYEPPFSAVPQSYQEISRLMNRLLDWLYENADQLSAQLREDYLDIIQEK